MTKHTRPIAANSIPMWLSYYISQRGAEHVGKKKVKKLLEHSETYEVQLWQILHMLKALLIFSSSEFSQANHIRLESKQKLIKKKSIKR